MEHIDLFSGIGGFALAVKWTGFETVVFCEKDDYCQQVLKKHWPEVPIIPEIRDFDGTKWRGATLLTGGFPCQPFSVAGKRKGKEDDRYLWPEMLRVIKEAKPRWILAENVAGIFKMALDMVLADLESEGYTTGTVVIPAAGVNAPHRRDRIWIIAHSNSDNSRCSWNNTVSERQQYKKGGSSFSQPSSLCNNVADSKSSRFTTCPITQPKCDSGRVEGQQFRRISNQNRKRWQVEPEVGRVAYGIPNRVDRLKSLGNAIVPQVAAEIMKGIKEFT